MKKKKIETKNTGVKYLPPEEKNAKTKKRKDDIIPEILVEKEKEKINEKLPSPPKKEKTGLWKKLNTPVEKKFKGKLGALDKIGIKDEVDYFLDNLAMLLSSGMGILDALETIGREMKSPQMKGVLKKITNDVSEGEPLWKSIENVNLLPQRVIPLLRIGEEAGKLSENLEMIVEQEQKTRIFKSKVKSGMMYPVVLLFFVLLIGIGISWFLLPQLATMFEQLKLDLPLPTKILLGVGKFLGKYGIFVIPSFLAIFFVLFYLIFFHKKTNFIGQEIILRLPVIKKLIQETEIARMGYLMGTLLEAGIPAASALESFEASCTIYKYRKLYTHLVESIKEGKNFSESFSSYPNSKKFIPASVQQMIITAERSEGLKKTFYKIGKNFEEKIETTTKNLSVLLEPILLIIIWMGVVSVAIAVILPIYSITGGINK